LARIFISHSSADNAEAISLSGWLTAEGWEDLFLDLDPARGIAAGERWEIALNEAANRCEAVLFLISRAWLSSRWCLRELTLAQKLNKRCFGVLIEDIRPQDLPGDLTGAWQLVSLVAGTDHRMLRGRSPDGSEVRVTFSQSGLARLKAGLARAGLDARFFAWPPVEEPDRPPYRGLKPLEADDAGIFFGREAPTIAALDRIRGLADGAPPRLLAILGASGAGKSSFLRAGLVPRLVRDDRAFFVLPIVRPERAAVHGETGLVRAIEEACRQAGLRQTRAAIRAAVEGGASPLEPLLAELAATAKPADLADGAPGRPPRIVLAVDQAEELFQGEGAEEAEAFLALLRDLVTRPASNLIVLFTIRSDSFERLQTSAPLDGLNPGTFSLPPMPRGAYQTIIEGPARRLAETPRRLSVEPALVAALLNDVEAGRGKDALPLLAFTLERLYVEYGSGGALTLAQYRDLGGIGGSIEAAVEGALKGADKDPAVPRDRAARLALLRRALIPWLAGIDPETGEARRRVARLAEIPEEARPLVDHLIAARLLATDVSPETGERTIEPAHEALLRQWRQLDAWLKEDSAALAALETIRRSARDWNANDRKDDWLAHAAGRLEDAEAIALREDFAGMLLPVDRDYLSAARAVDTARRNRELEEARKLAEVQGKVARRTRLGLIAASVLAAAAIGLAWFGFTKAQEADDQALVAKAQTTLANERAEEAEKAKENTAATLRESREARSRFLADLARKRIEEDRLDDAVALARMAMPVEIADWPKVRTAEDALTFAVQQYWDAPIRPVFGLVGHEGTVRGGSFSPDGDRLLTWSYDGTARLWDVHTGRQVRILQHDSGVCGAIFDAKGARILTWSFDGTARLWSSDPQEPPLVLRHDDVVMGAVFSQDESRILTWSFDGTARLWDSATGKQLAVMKHENVVWEARFFDGDKRILTRSFDKTVRVWRADDGAPLATLGHGGNVGGMALLPDGERLLTWSADSTARMWEIASGKELLHLDHKAALGLKQDEPVRGAIALEDGARLLTWTDKFAVLWDIRSGNEIRRFAQSGSMLGVALSKDQKTLLGWSADGAAELWNLEDGASIARVRHTGPVLGALFSPDEAHILSWSYDGTALLWGATADGAGHPLILHHDGPIRNAVFIDNGARFWTRSDDGTARLWSSSSPDAVPVATLRHQGEVFAIAWSGRTLMATVSADGTARIWETYPKDRSVGLAHDGEVTGAAFSADGARLLSWSLDNTARVWSIADGKPLLTLQHDGAVLGATFAAGDDAVVTWAVDRTVRLWDARTGEEKRRFDAQSTPLGAAYSAASDRLLAWSKGGEVRLWNTRTGEEVTDIHKEGQAARASLSGDGRSVLLWSSDGDIKVLDAATGGEEAAFRLAGILGAGFSPDGTRVLGWASSGAVSLWDIRTKELVTKTMHHDGLGGAQLSPAGDRIVGWGGGRVTVWNAGTGSSELALSGSNVVRTASFDRDPRRIWVWSADGWAHLWDIASGTELRRLAADGEAGQAGDGKFLLGWNSGATGREKLWDLETGQIVGAYPNVASHAALAPDGRTVATWSGKTIEVHATWIDTGEAARFATSLLPALQPLSHLDRCEAYIETPGCDSKLGETDRDLATEGDRFTAPAASPGASSGVSDDIDDPNFRIDLVTGEAGDIYLFHNRPFTERFTRLEYNRLTHRFACRMENGELRNITATLAARFAPTLEQGQQVMMVQMDEKTGEPVGGAYFPLLVY
jgi:WD40 repeat protein